MTGAGDGAKRRRTRVINAAIRRGGNVLTSQLAGKCCARGGGGRGCVKAANADLVCHDADCAVLSQTRAARPPGVDEDDPLANRLGTPGRSD